MRTVVIPLDFSENAFNALQYAAELFKYEKSDFFLLHAFAEEIYEHAEAINDEDVARLKKEVCQRSKERLEQNISRIKELFPNPKHNFFTVASFGHLIDEVNDLVNKENADITVMGTRGKTNDRSLTFGSNTLQVMKYIQSPVLFIPENFPFKTPEQILLPTNYMLPYQRRELKLVGEIARRFCADMHLLLISKFPINSIRQKENQVFLKDQLYDIPLQYHNKYAIRKEEAIKQAIEELKIDLLVMVNSRQTYLENMLSQSTIDKIGMHPIIPFLVLQNYHRS